MSSLSFSPSSSFPSSSSFSVDSSTTEPLSVREIQILAPMENVVRGNNSGGVADWSDPPKQPSPLLGLDWVYPKVTRITFTFLDGAFISSFLGRYPILKLDANDGILAVEHYRPTDTICLARSPSEGPFLFSYSCLFSMCTSPFLLMISRWASFRRSTWPPLRFTQISRLPFKPSVLYATLFRLSTTPSTFLSYYTSHPTKLVS